MIAATPPMADMSMPAAVSPPSPSMSAAAGAGMSGMAMPAAGETPAGDAPPPPPPEEPYADRTYGVAAMAASQAAFRDEHGGESFHQVLLNLAEGQFGAGAVGYRWDGQGWFGGDIDRLVVKSEGEGDGHAGLESGEVQGLYARAVTPFFDLQAGVRETFGDSPSRTDAVIGFEGLAPYWIDVEGALFVSNRGEVYGRLEGWWDGRITERLVLQPRVELNLSAQDTASQHLGSGLTDAELGLRLRYEIKRELAPYVGVSWERDVGRTADDVRLLGENPSAVVLAVGVRAWF